MSTTTGTTRSLSIPAALFALSIAAAASGQGMEMSLGNDAKDVEVRAPAPADPGSPPFALVYLAGFALSAAAVGLAVMPSKRTHQD